MSSFDEITQQEIRCSVDFGCMIWIIIIIRTS